MKYLEHFGRFFKSFSGHPNRYGLRVVHPDNIGGYDFLAGKTIDIYVTP
jgi:hypothetical protein